MHWARTRVFCLDFESWIHVSKGTLLPCHVFVFFVCYPKMEGTACDAFPSRACTLARHYSLLNVKSGRAKKRSESWLGDVLKSTNSTGFRSDTIFGSIFQPHSKEKMTPVHVCENFGQSLAHKFFPCPLLISLSSNSHIVFWLWGVQKSFSKNVPYFSLCVCAHLLVQVCLT